MENAKLLSNINFIHEASEPESITNDLLGAVLLELANRLVTSQPDTTLQSIVDILSGDGEDINSLNSEVDIINRQLAALIEEKLQLGYNAGQAFPGNIGNQLKNDVEELQGEMSQILEPTTINLPIIENSLKKLPFVAIADILPYNGTPTPPQDAIDSALYFVQGKGVYRYFEGDFTKPLSLQSLFATTLLQEVPVYICKNRLYVADENLYLRPIAPEPVNNQFYNQFAFYGCYRINGDYRASTGGAYRNSGLQILNRNHPLQVSGIRGDAGMAYVSFWDAAGQFISALALTQSKNTIDRLISTAEMPAMAAFFIVSAANNAPGEAVPQYFNGTTLEFLGNKLALMQAALSQNPSTVSAEDIEQ